MATTTADRGLSQFLPTVPKTPPLAPTRAAPANQNSPRTRRKPRAAAPSTPAPAPVVSAPQEPVMGETQESRRAKTVRMGQARMVNFLRATRLLGNMASSNYEWHEGEIARMEQVALEAVKSTFAKFTKTANRQKLEDMFQLMTTEG